MSICIGTPISEIDLSFSRICHVGDEYLQQKNGFESNGAELTRAEPVTADPSPNAQEQTFQSLVSTPPKGPGLG